MDIQISSNFERLLFDLLDRDGAAVRQRLDGFRARGAFAVSAAQLARARALFSSHRLDDDGILATIAATYRDTGELIDPHTAVGVAAARTRIAAGDVPAEVPVVALACAHPAKFPDAVARATGLRPKLPARLADLLERQERLAVLPNDLAQVQAFIRARARAAGAAA